MSDSPNPDVQPVRSATLRTGLARITIYGVPHQQGVAARIFSEIAKLRINIDDIIHTTRDAGQDVTISFTVGHAHFAAARAVVDEIAEGFGDAQVETTEHIARLRIVGMGIRSTAGVGSRLFTAIADEGINIENISTAEIVINVLVPEADGPKALAAVQRAFGLDAESDDAAIEDES